MNKQPVVTCIGIDVSKNSLDVTVIPSDDFWSVANNEEDISVLVKRLKKLKPQVIVLEATARLEVPVVGALAAEGLPVTVVNPRQVRDFARASGILAKTDRLYLPVPQGVACIHAYSLSVHPYGKRPSGVWVGVTISPDSLYLRSMTRI